MKDAETVFAAGTANLREASHGDGAIQIKQLRALWDHAPLAVWVHVDLRLVYVNPAGLATLGVARMEDILGRAPQDFVVAQDRHLVAERAQQALIHNRNTPPAFVRFQRMDGQVFPVQAASWAIVLDGLPALQVTFHDLTSTLETEAALSESESRSSQILEAMPGLVWTARANGEVDYFNRRWYEYTGRTRGQSEGFQWMEALHPDDLQPTRVASEHVIQTGEDLEVEYRVRGRDSGYRWFLVRGTALRDAAGKVVRWFGTCTDVEEQRAQREEIRQLNLELEARVHQRTAELEASNRELEAFSYSVSHDLRAPLRTIDGFSVALEEDFAANLNAEGRHFIQRIRVGVQHMGTLIDALLQLSRVTRADLKRASVDLTQMARDLAAGIDAQEPGRAIAWTIEDGMEALCDPKLIQIALENLLGNAAKFTGKRADAQIHFGAQRNDGCTEYYVRDNGAGFDMQYAGKLFNAFQRLHGDKDFKGSGIGLATVARVVRRHAGGVRAEGEIGKGAAFYFTLG